MEIARPPSGLLALIFCLVVISTVADARTRRPRDIVTGPAIAKDGDDIIVKGRQLRLDGIDAPEGKQRCELNCKPWDCGADAKRALDDYLRDRIVTCTIIRPHFPGRSFATCEVDGKDLGEWIVRQGWALDHEKYSKRRYKPAEEEAKTAKRGIWQGRFLEPWKCRRVKWPPECKGIFEGCPIEPKKRPPRSK